MSNSGFTYGFLNQVVSKSRPERFTVSQGKHTAIIVEPRTHPALNFVLKNVNKHLSYEWDIIVVHGNKNKEYVEKIVANISPRIKLHNLNIDNLTVADYNKLLTSRSFYDIIPTEMFLVFQTDSMICNSTDVSIDEFMEYDYVGAPFAHINGEVGNGGFSLRRKSKMLEILEKCPYKDSVPEDVYFSDTFNECKEVHVKKPSREIASRFSNESEMTEISFGIHKTWVYKGGPEKESRTPGLRELRLLNRR